MNAIVRRSGRYAVVGAVLSLGAAVWGAGEVCAQDEKFPARPIELIVNFGTGGSADQAGRMMGRHLPEYLGVPVPVGNITGASGNTGLTRVATAKPDGYTIGTYTGIGVTTILTGVSRLTLDQFRFLAIVDAAPAFLLVGKNSQFKSFQDLLDYAKANPGKVRVATAGFGTQDDVAVRALTEAGYPMTNVPMDPGVRYMAPLGGHAEAVFDEIDAVAGLVESGDLVPVVTFSPERIEAFPDVPTSGEFGVALNLPNWRGLAGPAGLPDDRAKILHEAMQQVLQSDAYRKYCEPLYACVRPMNLEETAKYVQAYYDAMVETMERLGLSR